jgi:hypothetical protein
VDYDGTQKVEIKLKYASIYDGFSDGSVQSKSSIIDETIKEITMAKSPEPTTETLAETENYLVWKAEEPDGETTYHVELGNVTVHFFKEEWDEFLELARSLE